MKEAGFPPIQGASMMPNDENSTTYNSKHTWPWKGNWLKIITYLLDWAKKTHEDLGIHIGFNQINDRGQTPFQITRQQVSLHEVLKRIRK